MAKTPIPVGEWPAVVSTYNTGLARHAGPAAACQLSGFTTGPLGDAHVAVYEDFQPAGAAYAHMTYGQPGYGGWFARYDGGTTTSVALLSNGMVAVVFVDRTAVTFGRILVHIYDASQGIRRTVNPFVLAQGRRAVISTTRATVVALPHGGQFVVAFHRGRAGPSMPHSTSLNYVICTPDGYVDGHFTRIRRTREHLIHQVDGFADFNTVPQLALLPQSEFVAVFQENDPKAVAGRVVRRHVDRLRLPYLPANPFSAVVATGQSPSVSSLGNGRYVCAFKDPTPAIRFFIFDGRSGPTTQTGFRADAGVSLPVDWPAVTTLTTGEFVIAWAAIGNQGIRARLFNPDGSPASDEFVASATSLPFPRYPCTGPSLAPRSDGGVHMIWTQGTPPFANVSGRAWTFS